MNGNTEMRAGGTNKRVDHFSQPTMHRDKKDRLIIHIPMTFKKRGGRKEIVLPHGYNPEDHQAAPSINKPLALAISLGHRWLDLLVDGQFGSVGELAEELSIDPSQLRRHLRLTCLSPGLVRGILHGKEPSGMSVEGLKDMAGWWEGQVE